MYITAILKEDCNGDAQFCKSHLYFNEAMKDEFSQQRRKISRMQYIEAIYLIIRLLLFHQDA